MSIEQNKSIVQRLFDEFYQGKVEVADELFAEEVTLHDAGNTMKVNP